MASLDLNPCCVLWKTRYSKLEEKRNALRQGVEILKGQIDRLQQENASINKACDQEWERANVVKLEKEKETSLRISMEKEIAALKSEICSIKPEVVSGNEDFLKEVALLQTCISERDVEIDHLKKLLAEDDRTAEREGTELERKRAAELQEALECEKSRADQACKKVDAAAKKAEEIKFQLETLKNEVETAKFKCEESNRKLEIEKQKAIKEKKRANEEKARTAELKKIAEANEKKIEEEKCHATLLSKQLDEEKQKVVKLQKEIQDMLSSQRSADLLELDELKRSLDAERNRAAREEKRADAEMSKLEEQKKATEASVKNAMEERSRADKLSWELQISKQRIHDLEKELCNVNFMLESERKKASQERKSADAENLEAKEKTLGDAEMSKMEEQKKVTEVSVKRAMEEKIRADNLSEELQKSRQRIGDLEKELCDMNAMLVTERKKVSMEQKRADAEQLKASEKIDAEMSKVEEHRKVAEASIAKAITEKSRADKLSEELQNSRQRIDHLERELCDVNGMLVTERKKVSMEQKRADAEQLKASEKIDAERSKVEEHRKVTEVSIEKAMTEKSRADKLSEELQNSRQRIDHLEKELCDVNGMLDAERKKSSREQKRADAEKLKAAEQERISLENEKRVMEEKCQADTLFQELENNRQKLQDMENEVHGHKLRGNLAGAPNVCHAVVNEQSAKVNLLRKQLKLEKQKAKHAKDVTKLEKDRNSILQQELHRLRQDFKSLLHHLDTLTDTFGSRHGLGKKSGLSNLLRRQLSRKTVGSPSDKYLHGDHEVRMSSLSSWDPSRPLTENEGIGNAGQCMESGMETELDLLLGGSRRKTLPSSVLNSNTASFSDEQLVGSQENIAGSLTTSVLLAAENTSLQETVAKQSDRRCTWNDGEKVGIVAENTLKSPVEITPSHTKKRRKILDEFECIKSMHSEGKRIFQEAEKKLSALHNTLVQPILEKLEKEKLAVPVSKANSHDKCDQRSKKRKASSEPATILLQADDSTVQTAMDKLESLAPTSVKRVENQVTRVANMDKVQCNDDDVISFERMMNGDYMKLLDLDNAAEEEIFRIAMKRPLSPTLPEIECRDSETRMDAQIMTCNGSRDQLAYATHNKCQLCCVVFSDMEDISSITRIFCAMRTCLARCRLFLKTNWLVQDILDAILLEKDLRPREKVCVFLSLVLHNLSEVSSGKPDDFHNQEWLDSFSAHIHSVLSNVEARNLFQQICDFTEFLSLSEDFILRRKILVPIDVTSSLCGSGSSFEILHEGDRVVLSPDMASTNLVMTGSIVLASVCGAIGRIGSICEVSFNILCVPGVEYSLVLMVLHIFACICGEEYFTTSDYCLLMKVVRSVVTFIEATSAGNTETILHPVDSCMPWICSCVNCPFKEGAASLEDVTSMLLEELQNCCHTMPHPAELAHSSKTSSVSCVWEDVLSSLELIASMMGWDWAYSRIAAKIFKIMESCEGGSTVSTALVAFIGELGRLGVESHGCDDARVVSIKCQLSDILRSAITSKCTTTLPMAIVSALIGLHPKGGEEYVKGDVELPCESSPVSDIMRSCLSSLSSEHISCLFGHLNPVSAS